MKIFGMGGLELVIILVIVLIIFGPKQLPKLGKMFGKGAKSLREGIESGKEKIDEKFEEVEAEKAEATAAEAVVAEAPAPEAASAPEAPEATESTNPASPAGQSENAGE